MMMFSSVGCWNSFGFWFRRFLELRLRDLPCGDKSCCPSPALSGSKVSTVNLSMLSEREWPTRPVPNVFSVDFTKIERMIKHYAIVLAMMNRQALTFNASHFTVGDLHRYVIAITAFLIRRLSVILSSMTIRLRVIWWRGLVAVLRGRRPSLIPQLLWRLSRCTSFLRRSVLLLWRPRSLVLVSRARWTIARHVITLVIASVWSWPIWAVPIIAISIDGRSLALAALLAWRVVAVLAQKIHRVGRNFI